MESNPVTRNMSIASQFLICEFDILEHIHSFEGYYSLGASISVLFDI